MNEFLAPHFIERVDRLALGVEPLDALRRGRIAQPIEMALDGVPYPSRDGAWDRFFGFPDAIGGLTRIPRHNSCRHALLFKPGLKDTLVIRLYDRKRRYAPRRISYPIPADIHTASPTRVRRPALYPGAAYAVSATATGMRGRVTWGQDDETPVRWARVEASVNGQIVGRAHGDDRGEFLLLLDSHAVGLQDLSTPLAAQVTVYGPPDQLDPSPADDPLADLPVEILLAEPDDISPGTKLPPTYQSTASSIRQVVFPLGVLLVGQDKFFFNP